MEYINITDLCLDEKYWEPISGDIYKTGHSYLGSPIETYDSCDNCDGALCHKCKTVVREMHWIWKMDVNELTEALIKKGVPEKDAREIAVHDGSFKLETNYRLSVPYYLELKDSYPKFYEQINKIDNEIIKVINNIIDNYHPTIFGDIQEKVLDHFKLENPDRYRGHVYNQISLYWISCKKNHKIACKIKEE